MEQNIESLCKLIIGGETTQEIINKEIEKYIIKNSENISNNILIKYSKSEKYILYNEHYTSFCFEKDFCDFSGLNQCYEGDRVLYDGEHYTELGVKLIEFGELMFEKESIRVKNIFYVMGKYLKVLENIYNISKHYEIYEFNYLFPNINIIEYGGFSPKNKYNKMFKLR